MRKQAALTLLLAAPVLLACAFAALLLTILVGRDVLFQVPALELSKPLRLSVDGATSTAIRVYELLSRGVGPNEPLLFTHPVTTRGRELRVGLLFIAAGGDDTDLIRLIVEQGADLSLPINVAAICAAVAANNTERARVFLEDLKMSANPRPRCLSDSVSPLALAEQLDYPDDTRDLLLQHGAKLKY